MIPGARLIVLGKQGAGKGTQCIRLARHYVIPHISTGDMFRAAVKAGTEFGRKANEHMTKGELVPDEVVIGVVRERLGQPDTERRGFVLDGFPRTVQQAAALDDILVVHPLDLVIDLAVPTEVVLDRLAGRRVCRDCGANYHMGTHRPRTDMICDVCGGEVVQREDDTEAVIRRRLDIYEEQTAPLIKWYTDRGRLESVDGLGEPDEVTARLIRAVDGRVGRP